MFSRLYETNTEDISKNLAYKRKDVSFIVDNISRWPTRAQI